MTLLLALWAGAGARAVAQEAPPQRVAAAAPRGFLWEARKGARHALLMGTLHVGTASDYPPDRGTRERLAAVEAIVLEADVSQAERAEAALRERALYRPDEPGLDTKLDAALKADTLRVLGQVGFPAESAWRMKPWMLGNTLIVLQASQLGFSPAYSTESYLVSLAASTGKPIDELEGIEAQFEMLDGQSWPEQVGALRQIVDSIRDGESEQELRELVQAWRGGDAGAMQAYLERVRNSKDESERRQFEWLITARNVSMAASIDRLLQDGRFRLVAVGSLHFFGPDGLVQALRKRGYAVTPITSVAPDSN